MKGVYFDGEHAVYREDLVKPTADATHSLIRILCAGVCNTDKEIIRGYRPSFHGVMGHEFVGIVEESTVKELIGKMVVGELNEGCGHCLYCRSGREKHCPDRKVIGMDGLDGCFAEYMLLANHLLHVVPEGLSAQTACYCEPLAAALEIPTRVHMDARKPTAIIGDGRLAFMIAQVLSLQGVNLTVIGKHEEKLAMFAPFAHTRVGVAIDEQTGEPFTLDDTYETVIEATGSPSGMDLAGRIVRRQGTIVLKSTYAGKIELDLSHYVVNEITISGSRCGPFEPALSLLSKGLINLPDIAWYDLSDFSEAFSSSDFKAGFAISLCEKSL